jgi:hypothetical protein
MTALYCILYALQHELPYSAKAKVQFWYRNLIGFQLSSFQTENFLTCHSYEQFVTFFAGMELFK